MGIEARRLNASECRLADFWPLFIERIVPCSIDWLRSRITQPALFSRRFRLAHNGRRGPVCDKVSVLEVVPLGSWFCQLPKQWSLKLSIRLYWMCDPSSRVSTRYYRLRVVRWRWRPIDTASAVRWPRPHGHQASKCHQHVPARWQRPC